MGSQNTSVASAMACMETEWAKEEGSTEERELIVAFLRRRGATSNSVIWEAAATAIEQGEHAK